MPSNLSMSGQRPAFLNAATALEVHAVEIISRSVFLTDEPSSVQTTYIKTLFDILNTLRGGLPRGRYCVVSAFYKRNFDGREIRSSSLIQTALDKHGFRLNTKEVFDPGRCSYKKVMLSLDTSAQEHQPYDVIEKVCKGPIGAYRGPNAEYARGEFPPDMPMWAEIFEFRDVPNFRAQWELLLQCKGDGANTIGNDPDGPDGFEDGSSLGKVVAKDALWVIPWASALVQALESIGRGRVRPEDVLILLCLPPEV